MPVRIERKLEYKESPHNWKVISEDEIVGSSSPVVILSDPGSGKTVLAEALGGLPGMKYVHAGTFVRQPSSNLSTAGGECVVIDGIDEIASVGFGSAVDKVLTKLGKADKPPFILTCRAADWRGNVDKNKIKDDYGVEPWLLFLQPFSYEDAHNFLSQEFPDIDATSILDQFQNRGIEGIYGNPLTLRLVGEILRKGGRIPVPRAKLLERACHIMLEESNDRHHDRPHALNFKDVLEAASAICGAVILCDRIGVYTGAYGMTPSGYARSEDIARLPFGRSQEHALKTRLFKTEGENCFTPIHRVFAEFLGAKWLVNCFNNGASKRRIFGLLRQGEGVPTSLRGLHAWIVHFSDDLAKSCIATDPIAVLKNGVTEHLHPNQARFFLDTLKKRLDKNPNLILSENPLSLPRSSTSGLMRMELLNDIRAIIEKSGQHTYLTIILLQSMVGRDLAKEYVSLLHEIMLDRDRTYAERFFATSAINAAAIRDSWEEVLQNLLHTKTLDSARLACEILVFVGANTVTNETAVEAILVHSGLKYDFSSESHTSIPDSRLFADLSVSKLPRLLDTLASRARPLIEKIIGARHLSLGDEAQTEYPFRHEQDMRICDAKHFITTLIRRLARRVLEAGLEVRAERIWDWIGWQEESDDWSNDLETRLSQLVCKNHSLRTALIQQVLLEPNAEKTAEAIFGLSRVLSCLRPTSEDIANLLRAWHKRARNDSLDPEIWRLFLRIGLSNAGSKNIVRDTAREVANGVPKLSAILAEEFKSVENIKSQRMAKQARQQVLQEQRFQSLRNNLSLLEDDFARGDFGALFIPATIYLGRGGYGVLTADFSEFSPDKRLHTILGDTLSEKAMQGFMTVLTHEDLPKAPEIVQFYCQNKRHRAEASMICGVAEMLRRGISTAAIDYAVLIAVYTAWHRAPELNGVFPIDIGSALQANLFPTQTDWENHFRTSIEPQLAQNKDYVFELRRLCSDPALIELAGRLAVEWQHKYPELSLDTQKQLINCMLQSTDRTAVRALVEQQLASFDQDSNERLLWLSVAFVTDFDNRREALKNAAAECPGFLWFIRDRIRLDSYTAEDERQQLSSFSLDQLAFIVQLFAEQWPNVTPPSSWSGERNPWDASDFITNVIHAIANIPSPEATEILQCLPVASPALYS